MSDKPDEGAQVDAPASRTDASARPIGALLKELGAVLRQRVLELRGSVAAKIMSLSRPRLVLGSAAGLFVAIVLGGVFSQELTASFRGALPHRIAGNERVGGVQTETGAIRIQLGQSAEHREGKPRHDKMAAITEVTGGNSPHVETVGGGSLDSADYRPKLDNQQTAGTVITIPSGQGRLLRFDEAVESVFIADPEVADVRVVSSDLVYVYGKKLGLTNLMAVSARAGGQGQGQDTGRQQVTASALLRVVMDNRPSRESQADWVPNTPVDISVFGRRTAVQGHLRTIDEAVDTANIAQTYSPRDQPPINKTTLAGSNQINIRVRFAEASRNDLKSFGIDWNIGVKGGSFSFGLTREGSVASNARGIGLEASAGNFNMELLIEALQANGALSILAEPNLTAVTGETASFLAGGEVPIPVPTGNGDAITVQYKPFGVSLSFTPIMVKENRISLRVKPEVSSIADFVQLASVQGFNMPSFTVRRAETTVEMASGQTFALAGLFQRDISRNVDKMPVLGDVPVLGQLFRSERYRRNETELVILITPYLVEPVSDRSLATPLDRAGPSPWTADIVDPSGKGALLTAPAAAPINQGGQSGFILK
jgi:pilus assembly protein CpaC